MLRKFTLLTGCYLLSIFVSTASLHATEDVDRPERVSALKQATGRGSTGSLYQDRLETTFRPGADAETSSVGREDASIREESQRIEALEEAGFETGQRQREEKQKAATEAELGEQEEEERREDPKDGRVEAGEKTHQEDVEKMYKEMDKSALERKKPKTEPEALIEPAKAEGTKQNLRPSLAHNPFYFSPETSEQFEQNKPIFISRLVQSGLPLPKAERIVIDASSPEEIIIALMQEEDYDYGEAAGLVGTR